MSHGAPEDQPQTEELDQDQLIRELLSLGHDQLTREVAAQIAAEVDKELGENSSSGLDPEGIGSLIEEKLKAWGILETDEVEWHPEDSTVALPEPEAEASDQLPRPSSLAQSEQTQLPTLERFLIPQAPLEDTESVSPHTPPRANLRISTRQLKAIQEVYPHLTSPREAHDYFRDLYEQVAQAAATAETRFPGTVPPDTLAVEFYNAMANQEFYPHLPSLLGSRGAPAKGGNQILLDLSLSNYRDSLGRAQKIWAQGHPVTFVLPLGEEKLLTQEAFEKLLGAIEQAILALPEDVEIPKGVGLILSGQDPELGNKLRLALSGKYYPKFEFTLCLPQDADLACLENNPRREALGFLWQRSELRVLFFNGQDAGFFGPGGGPRLTTREICHFGSLNLAILAAGNDVDWVKLRRIVRTAVHFLDNLFEVTEFADESIAQASLANRKIGLGIMGFAELLLKLGYPYDHEDTKVLAEKLMRFIHHEAVQTSQRLARDRGVFPNFEKSHWKEHGTLLRNASLTGAISAPFLAALAEVTPGIQPLATVVEDTSRNGTDMELAPIPLLKNISQQRRIWSEALGEEVVARHSVRHCLSAPKPLQKLFATHGEISPYWQLKIQGGLQKFSDGSVALAVELPETDGIQNLGELLSRARQWGIPQLTLKQKSGLETLEEESNIEADEATEVLLAEENAPDAEEEVTEAQPSRPKVSPRERPEVLQARSRQIRTPHGRLTVTIGSDTLGPYELLAQLNKSGQSESAQVEALSRLITLLFSIGVEPQLIYEQLRGIRGNLSCLDQGETVYSTADGVAKVLQREFELSEGDEEVTVRESIPVPHDEESTVVIDREAMH